MFDLEKAIKQWRKGLRKNEALEDGYIAELESHLRDEIDEQIKLGTSEEEAFKKAVNSVGQPEGLGEEFYKTHTRRHSGQPPWKPPRFMPELIWNYMKIALRRIKRQKSYSLINISGLTIGMTCCILILLFIHYEFSFDNYHKNSDSIYRVLTNISGKYRGKSQFNVTAGILAPTMKENFPEVIYAARIERMRRGEIIRVGNKSLKESRFFYTDPDFLKMFSFPLVEGDPEIALVAPNTILLSQESALKYFGPKSPMGKTLCLNNKQDYLVTGVFKDVLDNSHFKFDFLASFSSYVQIQGEKRVNEWGRFMNKTYFQLTKNTDVVEFEKKLNNLVLSHIPKSNNPKPVAIQALADIHFYDKALSEFEPGSDIRTIYMFSAIAFFIILIACFNYMNLSTAQSFRRTKEVGMRKVVGASRSSLIKQFLSESFVLTVLSFTLSVFIVKLFLPALSTHLDRNLNLSLLKETPVLFGLLGIILFIAFISGSYPALYLSSFRPVNILQGKLKIGTKRSLFCRNSLVVIQFAISIALIICTLVTMYQLRFIKNKDLGFAKDQVLLIRATPLFEIPSYEAIKNEFLQNPQIFDLTCSSELLVNIGSGGPVDWEGREKDHKLIAHILSVDDNFFDFYGIKIIKGRNFSKEFTTDKDNAYILNETTVKKIGWEEPIGKKFSEDPDMKMEGPVIGVVKDFHYAPLHLEIQPLHIRMMDSAWGWFSIKISSDNIPQTLDFLEKKWKEYVPEFPFEYSFLDERLDMLYRTEQKLGQSFNGFTLIALLIACLGLFGLASFVTEQRTKEIGIRKVLGASVPNVIFLLSKEFTKWVILANVIAWPVTYYVMNKWLQNFAYSINLQVWMFLLSGACALILALLTVGTKAMKTAVGNPVDALRYE